MTGGNPLDVPLTKFPSFAEDEPELELFPSPDVLTERQRSLRRHHRLVSMLWGITLLSMAAWCGIMFTSMARVDGFTSEHVLLSPFQPPTPELRDASSSASPPPLLGITSAVDRVFAPCLFPLASQPHTEAGQADEQPCWRGGHGGAGGVLLGVCPPGYLCPTWNDESKVTYLACTAVNRSCEVDVCWKYMESLEDRVVVDGAVVGLWMPTSAGEYNELVTLIYVGLMVFLSVIGGVIFIAGRVDPMMASYWVRPSGCAALVFSLLLLGIVVLFGLPVFLYITNGIEPAYHTQGELLSAHCLDESGDEWLHKLNVLSNFMMTPSLAFSILVILVALVPISYLEGKFPGNPHQIT